MDTVPSPVRSYCRLRPSTYFLLYSSLLRLTTNWKDQRSINALDYRNPSLPPLQYPPLSPSYSTLTVIDRRFSEYGRRGRDIEWFEGERCYRMEHRMRMMMEIHGDLLREIEEHRSDRLDDDWSRRAWLEYGRSTVYCSGYGRREWGREISPGRLTVALFIEEERRTGREERESTRDRGRHSLSLTLFRSKEEEEWTGGRNQWRISSFARDCQMTGSCLIYPCLIGHRSTVGYVRLG